VVSIIGIDRFAGGYQAAKVAHERELLRGPIPVRILRAAQFHEFVGELMTWGRRGDVIELPEMRTQLVSARAVGEALARLAVDAEAPVLSEIAGPREESLVEAGRLLAAARGEDVRVEGVLDASDPDQRLLAEGALLPGPDAVLAGPAFEEWLSVSVA
jgi:uncharacterized protein YbjT (DUF2867 family)